MKGYNKDNYLSIDNLSGDILELQFVVSLIRSKDEFNTPFSQITSKRRGKPEKVYILNDGILPLHLY